MTEILNKLKKIYKNSLEETIKVADSVRKLFESSPANELNRALTDVANILKDTKYVLIGGLAIGYHTKPRGTDDVDILLLNEDQVISVHKLLENSGLFKKSRGHASIHKDTGVEIELLSPSFIKQPETLVRSTIDNSIKVKFNGFILNVATAKHILALKLDRFNAKDKADIQEFIKYGIDDIKDLISDEKYLDRFEQMKQEVKSEIPLEDDEI